MTRETFVSCSCLGIYWLFAGAGVKVWGMRDFKLQFVICIAGRRTDNLSGCQAAGATASLHGRRETCRARVVSFE
jgi:hypothetical protein